MTVQNPIKVNYILDENHNLVIDEDETIDDLIRKYQLTGWLPYQWGVWVTSYARLKLEEGLHAIPYESFIYADTDSIKFEGDHGSKIEELNMKYKSEKYSALDVKGERHYIGIYEMDAFYEKFATMGAKKYAYVENGKLKVTISGVNKKEGGKELKSIKNFKEGFIFKKAGGNQAIYNDDPIVKQMRIQNHLVDIIPNIAIYPSTYTLGMTAEYERLVRFLSNVDIRYALHYER